jgi:8-oxo-dGTP pyrophosphatase MutT (NUDIX family)
MPPHYLEKVTAFITRPGGNGPEILLFQHPHAGIQIPAGTVEEDEPLDAAALREAFEETGLADLRIVRQIGSRVELPPNATHVILHTSPVYSRPDPKSAAWAEYRRGIGVILKRKENGYAQVSYEEVDRFPNPTYITYQITGWIPEHCLADGNLRYFYHLAYDGESPALWDRYTDFHTFGLFWAPINNLPPIVSPQEAWLRYLTGSL